MTKEQKIDQTEKVDTNASAVPAPAEATQKPALVKVRVLKTGTQIDNGIYAAGAIVTVRTDKAKTLADLGSAVVVGV